MISRFVGVGKMASILISRKDTILTLDDGRKFYWYPENTFSLLDIPLWGDWEPEETHLISKIINKGDTVFDIGANFGWYTTLLVDLVGETGEVHVFEPIATAFDELKNNLELNGKLQCRNLFLNNLAVSDTEGQLPIYLPLKQGSALSSFKIHYSGKHIEYKCNVVTLDSYVNKNKVDKVSFIKCDIEGAELLMLRGAKRILSSDIPPLLLLEVQFFLTIPLSIPYGYKPRDLFMFLEEYKYEFYYLQDGRLERLTSYDDPLPSCNFLCLIPSLHKQRLEGFLRGGGR